MPRALASLQRKLHFAFALIIRADRLGVTKQKLFVRHLGLFDQPGLDQVSAGVHEFLVIIIGDLDPVSQHRLHLFGRKLPQREAVGLRQFLFRFALMTMPTEPDPRQNAFGK